MIKEILSLPIVYTSLLYSIPAFIAWKKEKIILSVLLGFVVIFSFLHRICASAKRFMNNNILHDDTINKLHRLDVAIAITVGWYIVYAVYNGVIYEPDLYYMTVLLGFLSICVLWAGTVHKNTKVKDMCHSYWHAMSAFSLCLFILSWEMKSFLDPQ